MPEGLDKQQLAQISRQIEEQIQRQIYEAITQYMNHSPLPDQSPPQRTAAQTSNPSPTSPSPQQGQAGQIQSLIHGVANMVGAATRFGMSTIDHQKKASLQQLQQQLQAQLAAQNPNTSNNR
ncbi:MAG: hypothetical protein M0Z65_12950 [Firmicutes bacterium]|uniref:Uncharacterized protein n=1 Tax=Melghirimyces thermohalophilus TaxID=1236220 RepID=A0A1G6RE51_9BACL|nr:hypothetical protein [Melghirimyces thermohalophilus]MDA8354054.1 hypothetical protein [Bacillota bacterium]SDD02176.1 hypothetical protein SAMN04488112_12735 [Melghirimyces thermohalophilus]